MSQAYEDVPQLKIHEHTSSQTDLERFEERRSQVDFSAETQYLGINLGAILGVLFKIPSPNRFSDHFFQFQSGFW